MMGWKKRLFCTHSIWPNSSGAERMELAKMTGMTPPELTLSGRWLDWPPIMRRPTMRRALWMGMRRSRALDKDDEGHHSDHGGHQQKRRRRMVNDPQASVWTF